MRLQTFGKIDMSIGRRQPSGTVRLVVRSYNKHVVSELSDLTTDAMCRKAVAGQIDMSICQKGWSRISKDFSGWNCNGLAGALFYRIKIHSPKWGKIHPAKLRDKELLGLGADKYPEYVPRLQAILKPFGVKPQLFNQTSEDIAALFIAIEAKRWNGCCSQR